MSIKVNVVNDKIPGASLKKKEIALLTVSR